MRPAPPLRFLFAGKRDAARRALGPRWGENGCRLTLWDRVAGWKRFADWAKGLEHLRDGCIVHSHHACFSPRTAASMRVKIGDWDDDNG